MREIHIISTGASLITNAQRSGIIPSDKRIADESYWKQIMEDNAMLEKLKEFLKEDPRRASAELNTFLRVVENKEPSEIEVYLFGTETYSNKLCRKIIESFLKDKGFRLYTPYEVSGYFFEAQYDERFAVDEFKKDISKLIDRLIYIAEKKKQEDYKVYFNPTGGLKAHVMASAIAGFLTNFEVYYMNEEFKDVVFLPRMIYIPKGREIEFLEKLKDKKPISGFEYENLKKAYENEIQRLSFYGLVEVERDESGKDYRVRITNKGKLVLEEIKGGGR